MPIFDRWATTYDKSVDSARGVFARYETVLDLVVDRIGSHASGRVLDIGVGTGNLTQRLLHRGAKVVGLDPSEAMLAKANAKLSPRSNLQLVRASDPFLRIPFRDESFDAIASTYAYHHVRPDHKEASLQEMFRVLSPGGVWVVGDLMFEDEQDEQAALRTYSWLEREHFARIAELRPFLARLGAKLDSHPITPFTWVIWTSKPHHK
ncbi:MAG: class I SAM-dependent methyltransferase [Phycisphaerae bacterium]|nr:class I SAM-dependent methyltransferase [Phycisphaerae bacterium]